MRPPGEDDQSGGEQELAQVIPLRRLTHEQDETAEISPITPHGHTPPAVFEPPADPDPPEEYSVWEQPIAELIRRGEPGPTSKQRSRVTTRPRLTRLLLAAGVLAVLSGVLVLALSGWLAERPSLPTRAPASAHASVSETLARVNASRRAHTQTRARALREVYSSRNEGHLTYTTGLAASSRSELAGTPETQAQPTSSQGPRATVIGGGDETASPSQAQTAKLAAVSAQEAAAREFGFER